MLPSNRKPPVLTLTASTLGDVPPSTYDAWVMYVCRHIDSACGFEVEVDDADFHKGPSRDVIERATSGQAATIREALHALWLEWLEGSARC